MTIRRLSAWSARALFVVAAICFGAAWGETTSDPRVVRYRVAAADWPAGTPPLRIVHLSDTHAALPDMPPARLARIVAQANALAPDIVVLTGDYVSDKLIGAIIATPDAIAPLAGLRARYGVFAVPGNHDHWRAIAPIRTAFARAGIPLLFNAARRAGPVTIAGVDDRIAGTADLTAALEGASGPVVLLSHSPDIFPDVPAKVVLTLAGHTHGGQIAVPFAGPVVSASNHGLRYVRGRIVEGGRTMIVSAGLGTSVLPLRFGVPPELVVVTLGPPE